MPEAVRCDNCRARNKRVGLYRIFGHLLNLCEECKIAADKLAVQAPQRVDAEVKAVPCEAKLG